MSNILYNGYSTTTTSLITTYISHTYVVLGENLDIPGYPNLNLASIIANINLNGELFYRELVKQGIPLPETLEEFLKKKFLVINRDKKINSIL